MSKKLKYIIFTHDGSALCVAEKLMNEGNDVIVAQIQDNKELHNGTTEEPEDKKKRLSLYDGILKKHDAKEVIRKMKNIKNKEDWFVIFDMNYLWYYGEIVMKMGFTQGFFPTEEQFHLEDDRDGAKEFVNEHYPDLPVADVHEFKTIDEGIEMLNETEEIFVLKANVEGDLTVLPNSKDPALAKEELIAALNGSKVEYEKQGYILELKISDPIEITPQAVFYNGKLIFTDIDIENKPIGAGSQGPMTGCAGNLIIRTELDEKINDIAFPPIVYEMAAKHPGMMVWDSSILVDQRTEKMYFGEFCPNRWGYDAFFTEIAMSGSATEYFEAIVAGENPLKKNFGVGVRMFNVKKSEEVPIIIKEGNEKNIFIYDGFIKDDHVVTTGATWSLAVATGADDDVAKAIDLCYESMDGMAFTGGYIRPKFDFISLDYQNSILNRFNFTNHWLFEASDYSESRKQGERMEHIKKKNGKDVEKMKKDHAGEMDKMKSEHSQNLLDLSREIADALS